MHILQLICENGGRQDVDVSFSRISKALRGKQRVIPHNLVSGVCGDRP